MEKPRKTGKPGPALLFDLDGTLIDSVYQHILAWREALEQIGIRLSNASIHRRIGMSGRLMVQSFLRESGRQLTAPEMEQVQQVQQVQSCAYLNRFREVGPLPGAADLLSFLARRSVSFAIGTSGKRQHAQPSLDLLGVYAGTTVVTADEVQSAKPSPDLFLACAERLGVEINGCMIVGDSTWDIRRTAGPGPRNRATVRRFWGGGTAQSGSLPGISRPRSPPGRDWSPNGVKPVQLEKARKRSSNRRSRRRHLQS